jgi:hypothetical protein
MVYAQRRARKLAAKCIDDWRKYRRDRLGAAQIHLARARIGQELDLVYALAQFVERRAAAPEQRLAVWGGVDTPRAAIQEPHAKPMFKVADDLRHGGRGDAEFGGRARHAATL